MAQDFAKQFYASRAWRDLSLICKIESGGKCNKCGGIIIDPKELIAHHKVELTADNINNPNIALNKNNIEVLCLNCHNKQHRRFGNQHNVYIVWGSPLSGKSSYVKDVMQWGDIVIDVDILWFAISGQGLYQKPNNIRFNIFRLRDELYDQIKTRYGQWYDAYIIGGFANEAERNRLVCSLGAETIYIESTKEDCLERAKQRPLEWAGYVEQWWREFERYPPHCN